MERARRGNSLRRARAIKWPDRHNPTVSLPFYRWSLTAAKPIPGYPTELRHIGHHLLKRRLNLGLRQNEAARILGTGAWNLRNWETGRPGCRSAMTPAGRNGDRDAAAENVARDRAGLFCSASAPHSAAVTTPGSSVARLLRLRLSFEGVCRDSLARREKKREA